MAFFRFLDLPQEIRSLIYAELAQNINLVYMRKLLRPHYPWVFYLNEKDHLFSPPRRIALLHTCQQVRAEMLDYMALNITLEVHQFRTLARPAKVFETVLPSPLRQQLSALVISLPYAYGPKPDGPFSALGSLTEWSVEDTFPRLQQVTIKDSHTIRSPALQPVKEDATSHAVVVRSQVAKHYYAIKHLYDLFQGRSFDVGLYLSCWLRRPGDREPLSCWVC